MAELTAKQKQQLEWLGQAEPVSYDVKCRTCKQQHRFCSAYAVRLFVERHAGHETYVGYITGGNDG